MSVMDGSIWSVGAGTAVPLAENSASVRLIRQLRAEHDLEVNVRARREIEVTRATLNIRTRC